MIILGNIATVSSLSQKKGLSFTAIKYGYLYNWFALTGDVDGGDVISNKNIDNGAWKLPSDADFTTLTDYVNITYNVAPNDFGIGNHLKSCRQVNSPLGGDCSTNEHPRWNEDATHYGRDTVEFNALSAGRRSNTGTFTAIGVAVYLWTSVESSSTHGGVAAMVNNTSDVHRFDTNKQFGYCSRLFRLATIEEQSLPDGLIEGKFYEGNDGKIYRITKIGTHVWLDDNLAETKYANGTDIPVVTVNTDWSNLSTGARCAYDNDEQYV